MPKHTKKEQAKNKKAKAMKKTTAKSMIGKKSVKNLFRRRK